MNSWRRQHERRGSAARGLDGDCAVLLDDFLDRRVGKELYLALGARFGQPRQIFERMKGRLPGIAQRMAFIASVEGNADQTLDGCADGSHGVELLIDRVGRHTVALKQIAVEPAEVAIDPFACS